MGLDSLPIPESVKTQVREDVGQFLIESILKSVSDGKSPIEGESWPKLSKKYKARKEAEGLPGVANMEESGDMLDSLMFKKSDDGVELGFFGAEAPKADGHNKFSGKENNTPQRRFLPGEGESFSEEIQTGAQKIIADAVNDNLLFNADDFSGVTTTAELYSILFEYFPGLESRIDIRSAIAVTPKLLQLLDDEGLIDLL